MFTHPEGRRKDCPKGASCCDIHCVHLHPVTRNQYLHSQTQSKSKHLQSANSEKLHLQSYAGINKQNQQLYTSTKSDSQTKDNSSTKNRTMSSASNACGSHAVQQCDTDMTTSKAEAALHLLMKVVDSNEEFLLNYENRRLLKILGLKAKKKQAVLDEKFLAAHKIKIEIDNLCTCNTK